MQQHAPASLRQEAQLFSEVGVQITTARVIIGHQTYPVAAITSVSPFTVPVNRIVPLGAIILGAAAVLTGGVAAATLDPASRGAFVVMSMLGVAAVLWGLYQRTRKDLHVVVITTSGMQIRALSHTDLALVHRVVSALNQAIASR